MTLQSKQKIEYTLATHAIDKLIPSEEALCLCEQMASGAIKVDETVSSILEQYGLAKEEYIVGRR